MELGVCSAKQAHSLIEEGRVCVDGHLQRDPNRWVDMRENTLSVDGDVVLADPERRVFAFHKPRGYITTRSDPGDRPTIYTLLGDQHPWVFPVGRLDRHSSGLLILTNDRALAERIKDPAARVPKCYHARVAGVPEADALQWLAAGFTLPDGTQTRPIETRLLGGPVQGGTTWVELVLTEGRYRQVRRMLAAIGHDVQELVRVRIGQLELGDLAPGEERALDPSAVSRLTTSRG
jgi:pseudouridine synthase